MGILNDPKDCWSKHYADYTKEDLMEAAVELSIENEELSSLVSELESRIEDLELSKEERDFPI